MTSETREVLGAAATLAAAGDELVCGCTDLGRGAAERYLRERPAMRFDEFLDTTGAGSRCTACMLDLEYLYTQVRQEGGAATHEATSKLRSAERLPWKHRLYAFLDRVTPPVAQRMTHMLPILKGPHLEEHLWIANHALGFAKEGVVPTWRIDLTVRDDQGRVTHKSHRRLEPREVLSLRVSDYLPPATDPSMPVGGSVEVTRLAHSAGWRGTTRPQIELLTPCASSTVHGQGIQNKGEIWIPCMVRPAEERLMMVTVNCGGAPLRILYDFPKEPDRAEVEIEVPAHGTHVHELYLPPSPKGERLIDVRYRGNGPKVVHLLTATRNLDRVSIDHI